MLWCAKVAYVSPEGDPLWFTLGKGNADLTPTGAHLPDYVKNGAERILVYTLWKRFDLLPSVSTPSAVIPVLTGGADLMIPGGEESSYCHLVSTH